MAEINAICDYIILRLAEDRTRLNHLKLQKLVYYVQAWHLAFYKVPLFNGRFQAWVHGPVSRHLYDRFQGKLLYSSVTSRDVVTDPNLQLSEQERAHVDSVLEVYAGYTDTQLEEMTHREAPWIEARQGYGPSQRCERDISEATMRTYYAQRIQ